ncbi:MAG: hypothetical protein WCN98_15110, partial [Verrucomicrobiaceae bacterium]
MKRNSLLTHTALHLAMVAGRSPRMLRPALTGQASQISILPRRLLVHAPLRRGHTQRLPLL